jgi:four helix bundle protein
LEEEENGMKQNIIKDKTYQFALEIIFLYKKMQDQNEFILSKQIVRSGTSIGANARPVK